jgi:hypothetical protein
MLHVPLPPLLLMRQPGLFQPQQEREIRWSPEFLQLLGHQALTFQQRYLLPRYTQPEVVNKNWPPR